MNELEATRAKLKCLEMVEGTGLRRGQVVRLLPVGTPFNEDPDFNLSADYYEFALGVVEGKPVWGDSTLYGNNGSVSSEKEIVAMCGGIAALQHFHWNPPAPKTVMVELLVEDAKDMAYQRAFNSTRIAVACRKALEQGK